jgi:microcin C transport system permease protein
VHNLIEDQGGWMLFPPIPFSYDTVNYDLSEPAPSPPVIEQLAGYR